MGIKLLRYFDLVVEKQGLSGKMRLTLKTGITSAKAKDEPDSVENLTKFHEAVQELIGLPIQKI